MQRPASPVQPLRDAASRRRRGRVGEACRIKRRRPRSGRCPVRTLEPRLLALDAAGLLPRDAGESCSPKQTDDIGGRRARRSSAIRAGRTSVMKCALRCACTLASISAGFIAARRPADEPPSYLRQECGDSLVRRPRCRVLPSRIASASVSPGDCSRFGVARNHSTPARSCACVSADKTSAASRRRASPVHR